MNKQRIRKLTNILMLVVVITSIFGQTIYNATTINELKESPIGSSQGESEVTSEIIEVEVTSEIVEEEASEITEDIEPATDEIKKIEPEEIIDITKISESELKEILESKEEKILITDNIDDIKQPKAVSITRIASPVNYSVINSSMFGTWEIYKANGHYIYCIQPAVDVSSTATMTSESGSLYDRFSTSSRIQLGRIISSATQKFAETGNNDYIFAGQLLIWEYLGANERALLGNPIPGNPIFHTSWTIRNASNYRNEIATIESEISEWTVRPSFMDDMQSTAKGHTLKYNQSTNDFSITLTDTNGVWDSKFASYGKVGNYTLSNPSGANNVKITTSVESVSYTSAKDYIWEPYASGTKEFYEGGQDLIYVGSDPVHAYFKFKTEIKPLGGFKIKKVDGETNKVLPGAVFTLYNAKGTVVKSYTTDSKGLIYVGEVLKTGTYTLKETKAPTGYRLNSTPHSITIKAGTVNDYTANPFKNEQLKGGFRIKKIDGETKKVLKGAEFTLYNSSGTKIKSYTTDAKGLISEGLNIPIGNYTLKETKAPTGYVLNTTSYPIVIKADVINDYTATPYKNQIIKGGFSLSKIGEVFELDSESLAGVEFTVTSSTYPTFKKVYTTDSKGNIKTSGSELKYGVYTITETKAPSRFVMNFKQNFTIKTDGTIINLNLGNPILNKLYVNKVKFVKMAENYNNKDNVLYPLGHAKFAIYQDVGEMNGTIDRQDKLMDIQVTNDVGEITSKSLPEGSYYVKEIEPAVGYNINTKTYPFIIKNDGTLVSGSTQDLGTIENEVITGQAQLIKVGSKLCDKSMSRPNVIKDCQTLLPNVSFGVYQDLNNNGILDKQESRPVQIIQTDDTGLAVTEPLKYGNYFVKELNNPQVNYFMNDNIFKFTISKQDEMVFINRGVVIENIEKLGNIKIIKSGNAIGNLNDETVLLANAEYTIYDSESEIVQVLTTDENGESNSKLLSFGDYTIKETKAPEGYVLDETEYEFTINNETYENTIELEFTDDVIEDKISILKTDLASGDELPGAELNIIEAETGVIVDTWTSTTEAHIINLEFGDYIITETFTPEGYLPLAQAVKFSVTEDGVVQKFKIDNKLITNEIEITKTDLATGEEIEGAHLEIIDRNTNETVEKWTSTTETHIVTLPYGNYAICEQIAPIGYERMTTCVNFDITEDGVVQKFKIDNKLITKLILTGKDPVKVGVFVALSMVLVALITTKYFVKRKKA